MSQDRPILKATGRSQRARPVPGLEHSAAVATRIEHLSVTTSQIRARSRSKHVRLLSCQQYGLRPRCLTYGCVRSGDHSPARQRRAREAAIQIGSNSRVPAVRAATKAYKRKRATRSPPGSASPGQDRRHLQRQVNLT
jgi:hypothetical protein